jgi:hypothetical protein
MEFVLGEAVVEPGNSREEVRNRRLDNTAVGEHMLTRRYKEVVLDEA